MKKIKYLLFALAALFALQGCYSDDAENPKFSDDALPYIYGDWQPTMLYQIGDVIDLVMQVSPADHATFKWTLNGEVVSEEKDLHYTVTEGGDYVLNYEVKRFDRINTRTATISVPKPFIPKTANKRSVGFLNATGTIADVPWDDITHLVVTSSVVDDSGLPTALPAPFMGGLSNLITTAHNNGVYVLIEYSGMITPLTGAATYGMKTFTTAAANEATRGALIDEMVGFAVNYGFDGINVYLDKDHDQAVYTPAVKEGVKAFLDELAVAVPETSAAEGTDFMLSMSLYSGYTASAFDTFVLNDRYDFFHILAFAAEDLVPGPHSSIWVAFEPATSRWIGVGVPADKLVPLAPAFGLKYFGNEADYTWGNLYEYTQYIPYREIVATYPGAADVGYQAVDNGLWYDGVNEVKQKAEYAVGQGWGGMGLWTVENDTKDATSLMRQINVSLGN